MKRPQEPLPLWSLLSAESDRQSDLLRIIKLAGGPAPGGKYRHWDTLRHLVPPEGLTAEQWWLGVKFARQNLYQELPVKDTSGTPFKYLLPGVAVEMLQRIDRDASGSLEGTPDVAGSGTRDTYLFRSLVEEAITSSQLEGASTTRRVAKEMIQSGREPRNRSERMILNNYHGMRFVRELLGQKLQPAHILELQRILTADAIDDPTAAGRYRRSDEVIHVADDVTGAPLHIPPLAKELPRRMEEMCAFANGDTLSKEFVHPVVRAIVLHFWLGHDHPFVDGNGRTARALFYWAMANQGYWLCEFISISRILKKSRAQYSRAFLYSETDDNDLTYFLLNQMRVIRLAIDQLHEYLARKAAEIRETDRMLRDSTRLKTMLNHRQLALLNHAMKNPGAHYSIESHQRSHGISYGTSRSDLLALAGIGLLELRKSGRAFDFLSPLNLRARVGAL